jgi:hypothetical protein
MDTPSWIASRPVGDHAPSVTRAVGPARCSGAFSPPTRERYFEKVRKIFSSGRRVDSDAVQRLRDRYAVKQITPLRYGQPLA